MSLHTRTRRTQVVISATAVLGLLGAAPALSVGALGGGHAAPAKERSAAATAIPANVTLLQSNTSLLGVHNWYRQTLNGYPVVGGLYARNIQTTGASKGQVSVWDGRVKAGPLASTKAAIAASSAVDAAVAHTKGTVLSFVKPSLWVLPGAQSRLVWQVTTQTTNGVGQSHVSYVDAVTGKVLRSSVESKSDSTPGGKYVTGEARTFDPNPVVKLQDENITDQNDSNKAVPKKAYSIRSLGNLDKSHTLVGRWAKVVNSDIASSQDNTYMYLRANDKFEQVMGYYALDTMQSYFQTLGFDNVNAEAQKISTNTIPDDNSYYSPSQDLIVTGTGGVDDAEDPEVVWHEDGHATQDAQVPGFGRSPEAGAMGEGFGDYMAVTMGQPFGKDTKLTPTSCVMDWDATSYTPPPKHCLRTTQENKTYPDDLVGQVHEDGEIWSQALYEMNVAMGRDKATTAIIEGQFMFTPTINMPNAAKEIVAAAKKLYGAQGAKQATKAFKDRGIL